MKWNIFRKIRNQWKDALDNEYANIRFTKYLSDEYDRLWEIIPSSDEVEEMETKYNIPLDVQKKLIDLGRFMQVESVEEVYEYMDKLNP